MLLKIRRKGPEWEPEMYGEPRRREPATDGMHNGPPHERLPLCRKPSRRQLSRHGFSRHQRPCCPDSQNRQTWLLRMQTALQSQEALMPRSLGLPSAPRLQKPAHVTGGSTSPYDLRSASASPTRLRITSDRLHLFALAKRMMLSASSLSCSRRDWAARSAFAFFFTSEPAPVIVCEFTGSTGRADPALATLSERRREDVHEYPSVAARLAARR